MIMWLNYLMLLYGKISWLKEFMIMKQLIYNNLLLPEYQFVKLIHKILWSNKLLKWAINYQV